MVLTIKMRFLSGDIFMMFLPQNLFQDTALTVSLFHLQHILVIIQTFIAVFHAFGIHKAVAVVKIVGKKLQGTNRIPEP